jgi:subtilisin family serine protease
MELTSGTRNVVVGLLDGPVVVGHPELASESIQELPRGARGGCVQSESAACRHGTFVAGILVARRGGVAPAICPGCTLLVRPIFGDGADAGHRSPGTTPPEVAAAVGDCVDAGARVLNLSAGTAQPSTREERELRDALDYAAARGVIVVAAAGNQATLGSSAITRHPWVVPVVGYGLDQRPIPQSNLGCSMGRRGLGAPGERITSLSPSREPVTWTGTSVAAAFVTGAVALLWSRFPDARAGEIKSAVSGGPGRRRSSVAPPLLDAWRAYQMLSTMLPARVAV